MHAQCPHCQQQVDATPPAGGGEVVCPLCGSGWRVVDASTTGEEGLFVFERILNDARMGNLPCSGVLILSEDQVHWQEKISQRPNQIILVQPVMFKQLFAKVQELLGLPAAT